MSLDVALSIRATLRPAIEPAIPGKVTKVYFELVPDDRKEPWVQVRSGGGAPGARPTMREHTKTVYIDVWTLGTGDMARLEKIIRTYDQYLAPDYGDAVSPYWRLSSETSLSESALRLHNTYLFEVTYQDRNLLRPR